MPQKQKRMLGITVDEDGEFWVFFQKNCIESDISARCMHIFCDIVTYLDAVEFFHKTFYGY